MNAEDVVAFSDLLNFLQAIGVGFGDLLVLVVVLGVFWLVSKGKVKIGNGNGYASDDSVRELGKRLDRHFTIVEGLRGDVADLKADVARVEGAVEQYKR